MALPDRLSLFVSCAPGLEPWLAAEVDALLGPRAQVVPGGVELEGDLSTVHRANLQLGLAQQVRVRVGRFRVTALPDLVRKAQNLPWERWLAPGAPIRMRASARRSRLYHTGAINERIARAIGARLGAEPVVVKGEDERGLLVHARFEHDEAVLSVDTSGDPLHRRGWRLATAKAPLREDLARALVVVSGWDRQSVLVDPMMGSGTIAIEAALLARGMPPGAGRRFAFQDAPEHDERRFEALRARLVDAAKPALAAPIVGRDRDAGAVAAATSNAARAGVELELVQAPLSAPLPTADVGALVTNPPWGLRVSGGRDLRPLYQRLGELVGALPPAWSLGVACGDPRLAKLVGPLTSAAVQSSDRASSPPAPHMTSDEASEASESSESSEASEASEASEGRAPQRRGGRRAALKRALLTDAGGTKVAFYVRA
ncbi:MAG: RNA methyltransferase [Myxococcales bacterium]|nr:RNA methyltransferase [Myxococcales bacterium]